MTARGLALALVCAGAAPMALLVVLRARAGVWGAEAFDTPPAVPRWAWPLFGAGLLLALAGVGVLIATLL